jgi:hypothetical protein
VFARELACAALGWALGIALWIGAARLPRSMLSDDFGADGVPRGLAILMVAVSTLIAVRALLARRLPREAEERVPLAVHARAFGIIGLGFAYVLLAPFLGYLPTAAILIVATAIYYGTRFNLTLAGVAVAGAAFLWLMFAKMLSVSMPAGSLWRMFGP